MSRILAADTIPSPNYLPGWFVGSVVDGKHQRHTDLPPYSVYRRARPEAREGGVKDQILAYGIKSRADAVDLANLLNARMGLRSETTT